MAKQRGERSSPPGGSGTVTPEMRQGVDDHEAALDAAAGELAVKLCNTIIGDVWLVADAHTLAEHPDIEASGLPVFFFDEVERLRGKSVEALQAIGKIKSVFPTSRVQQ